MSTALPETTAKNTAVPTWLMNQTETTQDSGTVVCSNIHASNTNGSLQSTETSSTVIFKGTASLAGTSNTSTVVHRTATQVAAAPSMISTIQSTSSGLPALSKQAQRTEWHPMQPKCASAT